MRERMEPDAVDNDRYPPEREQNQQQWSEVPPAPVVVSPLRGVIFEETPEIVRHRHNA